MHKQPVTYLCGPIGLRHNEDCRIWREDVTEGLKKLGIRASNPFTNSGNTLQTVRDKLCEASDDGDVHAVRYLVDRYLLHQDLEMVKKCDFITAWIPIDNGYEICGSYGEITLAHFLGKPVYIVTNRVLKPIELPHWAVGCSTETFKSWEEYYDYIKRNWTR